MNTTLPAYRMSEAAYQRRILDLCDYLGLYVFHSTDPRRDTESGWPDLVLLNLETGATIFAELKTDAGKVTAKQAEVLLALERGGNEAVVWRPKMWPEVERRLRDLAVGS